MASLLNRTVVGDAVVVAEEELLVKKIDRDLRASLVGCMKNILVVLKVSSKSGESSEEVASVLDDRLIYWGRGDCQGGLGVDGQNLD